MTFVQKSSEESGSWGEILLGLVFVAFIKFVQVSILPLLFFLSLSLVLPSSILDSVASILSVVGDLYGVVLRPPQNYISILLFVLIPGYFVYNILFWMNKMILYPFRMMIKEKML